MTRKSSHICGLFSAILRVLQRFLRNLRSNTAAGIIPHRALSCEEYPRKYKQTFTCYDPLG